MPSPISSCITGHQDLIQRAFGCEMRGKRPGLLRTFHARKAGAMERLRRQMGVLVLPAAWLEKRRWAPFQFMGQ